MTKRVLIVTGSYAPTMIADMHRARQLAWELPGCGWEVEILCPGISYQPASCNDADGAGFFAPGIKVHAVSAWLPRLFRLLRIGNIGLRALAPLYGAGCKLLATQRFDLVYFSTAQFPLFLLGPAWRRRFAVPYVVDLHDPIAGEKEAARGGLKRGLSRYFSRFIERRAVSGASGVIAVSPRYIALIEARYARSRPQWLKPGRATAIPFGALPQDLEEARRGGVDNRTAAKRIVYVGTGGPVMARAFAELCRVLAELRRERSQLLDNLRIELHGTASAITTDVQPYLARIAGELAVGDLVAEYPARVTYRRSLELLLESDGALVLGVDDAGYMPSKLVTYMYSGKPLLGCLHRDGPAYAMIRAEPAPGHALWFCNEQEMPIADAVASVSRFLEEAAGGRTFAREAELKPYMAAAMARRHAELFQACLVQAATA